MAINRSMLNTNENNAQRVLATLHEHEDITASIGDIFTRPSPSDPLQNLVFWTQVKKFLANPEKKNSRACFHHFSMMCLAWVSALKSDAFPPTQRSLLHSHSCKLFGHTGNALGDNPSVLAIEKQSGTAGQISLVCGKDVLDDFSGGEIIVKMNVKSVTVLPLLAMYLNYKNLYDEPIIPFVGDTQLLDFNTIDSIIKKYSTSSDTEALTRLMFLSRSVG